MKLLLSSLLLLCSHSSHCVSLNTLDVSQSPNVCVLEAETVELSCCWKGNHSRVGIKWLKNQTSIKAETIIFQSRGSPSEQQSSCSTLSFSRITSKDSGRYICRVSVEIPFLTEDEGNGTTITVTAREKTADDSERPTESTTRSTTIRAESTKPGVSLVVHQSPDVSVLEGETVDISCCWKGKDRRVGIKWLKNNTYVKKETVTTPSQGSPQGQTTSCSALSFSGITRKDSGRYICSVSVEIPVLTEAKGSGTTITVRARERTLTVSAEMSAASQEDLLPFVMRCLPILTLITAFFWLYYSGTKAQKKTSSSAAGNEKEATPGQSREEDQGEDETHL